MKKSMKLGIFLLIAATAATDFWAQADEKAPRRPHAGTSSRIAPSVLNFDADVIEGEKSNPDLFIQLGNQQPSLQAVIYGRKNFNEFQQHESPWRPVYREVAPTTSSNSKNGKSAVRPSK
jgi:hypothetical protein